jgi:hypothetical protein
MNTRLNSKMRSFSDKHLVRVTQNFDVDLMMIPGEISPDLGMYFEDVSLLTVSCDLVYLRDDEKQFVILFVLRTHSINSICGLLTRVGAFGIR